MQKWLPVAGFIAIAAGCATAPGAVRPAQSPDIITQAEIRGTTAATAYDLVSRLRPLWLRATAPASIGGGRTRTQTVLVYLDENRLGGIDALGSVSASLVRSIRYLNATRAPTVLRGIGSEPIAGAIVIVTTN